METQIIKEVKEVGNGAHIIAPKEWIGQKVIVTLPERNIKEDILEMVLPHLPNIKGVYLYGSYARKEETPDSDIDVLVIADKKFSISKKRGYEVVIATEESIEKTIKNNAVIILPIIKECRPIINQKLLEKYKGYSLTRDNTKWYIETTKSSLKIAEQLIKEKDTGGMPNIVYPLMMRTRGLYLIKKNGQGYSNQELEELLIKKGLPKDKVRQLYRMYRENRDKKRISQHSLGYPDVEKLQSIANSLLKEIKSIWEKRS